MKRGTPSHPKTHELAEYLDRPLYVVVGLLELLWHFTSAHARCGDIGRHTDRAIAKALDWTGDPCVLIEALVRTRWVDVCPCHRLRIHDWPDHADDTTRKAVSRGRGSFLPCYAETPPDGVPPESVEIKFLVREHRREHSDPVCPDKSGPGPDVVPTRGAPAVAVAVAVAKPLPEPLPVSGTPDKPAAGDVVVPEVAKATPWSTEACDDWVAAYHGIPPGGRIGKALKPLVQDHGWPEVRAAWRSYLAQTEAEYASPQRFSATYGRWSGEARAPTSPSAQRHRADSESFIRAGLVGDGTLGGEFDGDQRRGVGSRDVVAPRLLPRQGTGPGRT